jgi:hypothetical protein
VVVFAIFVMAGVFAVGVIRSRRLREAQITQESERRG